MMNGGVGIPRPHREACTMSEMDAVEHPIGIFSRVVADVDAPADYGGVLSNQPNGPGWRACASRIKGLFVFISSGATIAVHFNVRAFCESCVRYRLTRLSGMAVRIPRVRGKWVTVVHVITVVCVAKLPRIRP